MYSIITLVIILFQVAVPKAYAASLLSEPAFGNIYNQNQLQIIAPSAIIIDAKSKKILYQKDSHAKLCPASTTKVLTALIALEKGSLDDIITVDESINTVERGSSIIGLKIGEKMSLHELLYGLLLESGNDAAVAIAVYIGGSIKGFSDMMNHKVVELGLHDSNFINPHGLYNENHYTSVYDLATIAIEARKYKIFTDIVQTHQYEKSPTNITPEKRTWINSNRLISHNLNEKFRYEYATGIKTGYTTQAQHSLIASAKYGDTELVAVVMNDTKDGKWTDCIQMFNYGFNNYTTYPVDSLIKQGNINQWTAKVTDKDNHITSLELRIQDEGNQFVTLPHNASLEKVTVLEKINASIKTPIKKGDVLGKLQLSYNHEIMTEVNLVSSKDVSDPLPSHLKPNSAEQKNVVWLYWWWIFPIAIILGLISRVLFTHKTPKKKYASFYRSHKKR